MRLQIMLPNLVITNTAAKSQFAGHSNDHYRSPTLFVVISAVHACMQGFRVGATGPV